MKEAVLCFPHQLFKTNPLINKSRDIFLIEDSLFFGDAQYPANFHKKKLVFHRTTMKYYEEYLSKKNYNVFYLEYNKKYREDINNGSIPNLFEELKKREIEKINILDPVDWAVEKRITTEALNHDIKIIIEENPGFLCEKSYIRKFFQNKKSYNQTSFYIAQRKRLNILIQNGRPKEGKWTFDTENRKKIPKNLEIPKIPKIKPNKYIEEAINYIEQKFPNNPGKIEPFIYPTTHKEAHSWFINFLKERFEFFGPYEDAMKLNDSFLFHSVLSPLLNIGLLTPDYIVKTTLNFAQKSNIPINSLEGFLRQIIGWREFMRAIYVLEGVNQRNSNYWNHKNPIPESFYDGTTNILPVDNVIKRLLNTAYLHHIERLMILSNFMNLCEINPNDIYHWFMELFIDAYDWVMVPNIYGMSLNADGGLSTTKPYISSSNYILKMSDYQKGDWCDIWNGLYWRFIHEHHNKIKKNPRMGIMVNIMKRMDKNKLNMQLEIANNFLNKLHNNI
jgi:deoxyribodipyrimidine photolyase-related protein